MRSSAPELLPGTPIPPAEPLKPLLLPLTLITLSLFNASFIVISVPPPLPRPSLALLYSFAVELIPAIAERCCRKANLRPNNDNYTISYRLSPRTGLYH
jgi:hypothetical protein